MIEGYARWIVRRPVAWAIVIATLVFGAACGWFAMDLEQDDDVLAFLPANNPEIQAFRDINARFGSTDVALVGIATVDPFDRAFLERLQKVTNELGHTEGIDSSLSLTNVTDFVVDEVNGGIITGALVSELPADEAAERALRERVMSRDHIVGTMVSKDADAVLLFAFGSPNQEGRDIAARVRAVVEPVFPESRLYWGGAPFYSTWIYETSQRDIDALTPWSILTKLLILLVAFRDVVGTGLGLLVTAVGLAASRAAMNATGTPFNVVLSSMPVILFATGSAYAIHILSTYNQVSRELTREGGAGAGDEAVVRTLKAVGPTTLTAGLVTVASLMSFVTMDIEPMRTFGVFTGFGLLVALALSLSFVPAVVSLFPRPERGMTAGPIDPFTRWLSKGVRARRPLAGFVVALITAGALWSAAHIDARMDLQAFFTPESEPDQAERFLEEKFAGSQFIQILVHGDLEEPEALREIGRIGDLIEVIPEVSDVTSVEGAIGLVGEAMVGARRVPDTSRQVASLYKFLESDRASGRLVQDGHKYALMQVKLASGDPAAIDRALEAVEKLVAEEAVKQFKVVKRGEDAAAASARLRSAFGARLGALARSFGVALPADVDARLDRILAAPPPPPDPAQVGEAARKFLLSGESFVTVTPEEAAAIAAAVSATPSADTEALKATIGAAIGLAPTEAKVADLALALEVPLGDVVRTATADAAARALVRELELKLPDGDAGRRLVAAIAAKLQDRGAPDAMVADAAGPASLTWTVSGSPVLYRGLSASVRSNLFRSMFTALALVVLIISGLFRSLSVGLLAATPTAFTLALIYGAMGLFGIHLDIGTSMVASLILGAGVDYAVHFLWSWRAAPGGDMNSAIDHAVDDTCHGIWTNGIAFAMGFYVLAMGEARALQNVGSLTAAALLVAAFATFVLIPLLANRKRYVGEG